mmetsp:Transcript_73787/g.195873  ORF Transcript_73787/g.195873 Transcript_73787/m.195873 type:complete len:196 (+) Transcript_73787:2-589(+)
MLLGQRQGGFVQPAAERQVPRRELLQLLPGLAVAAGAAPSYGDSGITEPWGLRSDGSEDDLHTGGVAWEDIKVGTGATAKVGDLIAVDYKVKCVVKERQITIEDTKGTSRDYRFGIGQMLPGMDEGIRGMRTGGVRKLQIPGKLAFGDKGIPAALGRPAVPAMTPVEVEVTLNFIPGRDEVYEYGEEGGSFGDKF